MKLVLGFVVGIFSSGAFATDYELDVATSAVSFQAVGKPGFLKIKGEGAKATGKVTENGDSFSGKILVHVPDFKTGIEMRDEHMHGKYLESAKFPQAELTLKNVTLSDKSSGVCKFDGDLTLKGVTKPVRGECTLKGFGTLETSLKASMVVKIDDYPIGVPSHLGITVADTVTVEVDAKVKKK